MICVDASVAVKWIFPEEYSREAAALLEDSAQRGERLIAPQFLPVETNNTIRRRMQRDGLTLAQAQALLGAFLRVPVTLAPTTPAERERLHQHALALADRFALPAVYDAYYLALADLRRCPLWTDDRKLLRAVGEHMPNVRWIADYRSR